MTEDITCSIMAFRVFMGAAKSFRLTVCIQGCGINTRPVMLYLLCQKSDGGEMKETSNSHLQVDEDKYYLIDPSKKTSFKDRK